MCFYGPFKTHVNVVTLSFSFNSVLSVMFISFKINIWIISEPILAVFITKCVLPRWVQVIAQQLVLGVLVNVNVNNPLQRRKYYCHYKYYILKVCVISTQSMDTWWPSLQTGAALNCQASRNHLINLFVCVYKNTNKVIDTTLCNQTHQSSLISAVSQIRLLSSNLSHYTGKWAVWSPAPSGVCVWIGKGAFVQSKIEPCFGESGNKRWETENH